MDYEYFHAKSKNWLKAARNYSQKGYLKDAIWCCKQSLELEDRGLQGLITVSCGTSMRNKYHVKAIRKIIDEIKKDKRLGGNHGR